MFFYLLVSLILFNPQPLVHLTVMPEKPAFRAGEPVTIFLSLENQGNIPLQVDTRFFPGADETFGQEITLFINDPGERPIPLLPLFEPSLLTEANIAKLAPGESIRKPLPLSNIVSFSTPGTYMVQAVYSTGAIRSLTPIWRGKAVSPPALFSIIETEASSPSQDRSLLQVAADKLRQDLVGSRVAAIDLAMQAYKIPPFQSTEKPGWELDVSPFSSADWMIGPWGRGILGNRAFQSSSWLGASLWGLRLAWDHAESWPYSFGDQHLALALITRQILAKSADLNLSVSEISLLEDRAKRHEELLDSNHKTSLAQGQWPSPIPWTPFEISHNAVLSAPPVLGAEEAFFKISLQADGKPMARIPLIVAEPKEAGYRIQTVLLSNEKGEALIEKGGANSALLIAPLSKNLISAHRIPIIPLPPSSTFSAPSLLSLPDAVRPRTEQSLKGANLLQAHGKTTITLNEEEVSILALSPSFALVKIPSRLPGPVNFKVTTPQGEFTATIPLVLLRGELLKKKVNRGERTLVTLQQWGSPKVNVWVSSPHPRVIFEDGASKKIVELLENKPVQITIQGVVPGPFELGVGVIHPAREKALAKLNDLKKEFNHPKLQNLFEQTAWAVQQGEISKAEGLIEELRYQALLQQGPRLPAEEILTLLH